MYNAVAFRVGAVRTVKVHALSAEAHMAKAVRIHGHSAVARGRVCHSTHGHSEDSHVQCGCVDGECREDSRVQGGCSCTGVPCGFTGAMGIHDSVRRHMWTHVGGATNVSAATPTDGA